MDFLNFKIQEKIKLILFVIKHSSSQPFNLVFLLGSGQRVQHCFDQSDSKILETPITQEKCEFISDSLHMDIQPEELQINVAF